jgi:hypothetical protein
MSLIQWRDKDHGLADLEAVRRLYKKRAVNPADGGARPLEPSVGHVFKIGTNAEPVCISSIDFKAGKVSFVRMPARIAESVFSGNYELSKRGVIVPVKR